jgi:hypothetical protein
MVGMGLGGILSNTLSGLLIDVYGVTMPAKVAGAMSALLALAIPFVLPAEPKTDETGV